MPLPDSAEGVGSLAKTVMFAAEFMLPGASQVISGKTGAGVATFVGNGLAVALLAPAAPLVAAVLGIGLRVNSYVHATEGQTLFAGKKE